MNSSPSPATCTGASGVLSSELIYFSELTDDDMETLKEAANSELENHILYIVSVLSEMGAKGVKQDMHVLARFCGVPSYNQASHISPFRNTEISQNDFSAIIIKFGLMLMNNLLPINCSLIGFFVSPNVHVII